MEIAPQIFTAKVMHKRLFPKVNRFTYGVYYVALPLSDFGDQLPTNQFGALSFYDKDHGAKDGSNLEDWVRTILSEYGLNEAVSDIMLITMPRVLGYVFNPVSFWLCLDEEGRLRAVLCEVNNTFGETHCYLCAHEDKREITADDWLDTGKVFHVSPFLPREGNYRFRFSLQNEKLGMWIDYYDKENNKQLITALTGTLKPLNKASLRKVFWTHPLVTVKTIMLIHWQALKLFSKGIKYIVKPQQNKIKLTATSLPPRGGRQEN